MKKNETRKGKEGKKGETRRASKVSRKGWNVLAEIFAFRWLKKSLFGKSRAEAMDLLDQWILRKRPSSLFF